MSTHTPGPWTTRKRITGEIVVIPKEHDRMPDNWILAECRYQGNDEANAALIAAAPAMYEALKLCVEALEFIPCRARNEANEALRLAEGRG